MLTENADSRLIKAKELVTEWYNKNKINPLDVEGTSITEEDVYVVWFCKTLQHWKALVSTNKPDTRYYEVTFNGDTEQAYIDVYTKEKNETVFL